MAGICGSGGGAGRGEVCDFAYDRAAAKPFELSIFVNNVCNLDCKHCYVGYHRKDGGLTAEQWASTIIKLHSQGLKTLCIAGKEPLAKFEHTMDVINAVQSVVAVDAKFRIGIITNGTLITQERISRLIEAGINYIDVSLDGARKTNDVMRGMGVYDRVLARLTSLDAESRAKISISFTATPDNIYDIPSLFKDLSNTGIKRFTVTPFIDNNTNAIQELSATGFIAFIQSLKHNYIENNCEDINDLEIFVKTGVHVLQEKIDAFVDSSLVREDELKIDEYNIVFDEYVGQSNTLRIQHVPNPEFLKTSLRISHDGYLGNCYDMFFSDYPDRAISNVLQ